MTFQNTDIKICLPVQNSKCPFNKSILPQKILLLFDRCAFKNCVNCLSTYFETYEVHFCSGDVC